MRLATPECGPRSSAALLLLILVTIGFSTTLQAIDRPFWYDEICTVILSRLPNVSEIWKALNNAADTNPPLYYLITRFGRHLIDDDVLGYRLPSILGLLVTVVCIYAVLARRVDRLSAIVGAAFVLGTPLVTYGSEARPYALMIGCVAAAMFAWQRIGDSIVYCLALAVALAAALSLHYYAILVWPAFVLAEAAVWVFSRRFRAGAWIALVAGAIPLIVFADLLVHLRQYYGQNFWARPSLGLIVSAPSYLFNSQNYWAPSFAVGSIVILGYWCLRRPVVISDRCEPRKIALSIEDCVLAVVLLMLPAIAVVAAKLGGGGMTSRYMLPAILGGALAVGYLTSHAAFSVRALLLALILMNYGWASVPDIKKLVQGTLHDRRGAAARDADAILTQYGASGLPVVISAGLQYLPMAYYTAANADRHLYLLADPAAAVKFGATRSDSSDLGLLVLRRYFPLHVEDYGSFASGHREFVLISDGSEWDWWPSRLAHDGNGLTLVSADGGTRVYKVSLKNPTVDGQGPDRASGD